MRERPVRRDPYSGHLIPHAAYEGWRPRQAVDLSWAKVILGPLIIAAVGYYALIIL